MKTKKLLLLILLPFLSSCTEPTSPTITINTTENRPVVIYTPQEVDEPSTLQVAWSHLKQGNEWTKFTQDAIRDYGQDLLNVVPNDIGAYCPKYLEYGTHKRGDFWVHLISKLAYFESSYNIDETYQEEFPDNDGNRVISRGLLQLSIESANGNYNCKLNNAQELHDPKTNLECAVRIFNKLVVKDGTIARKLNGKWQGASRYWSPFRDEVRNSKIMTYMNSLNFCH